MFWTVARMAACVKVFGCRLMTDGAANSAVGGRRPKSAKGGNRGKGYVGDAACAMGICLRRMNECRVRVDVVSSKRDPEKEPQRRSALIEGRNARSARCQMQ